MYYSKLPSTLILISEQFVHIRVYIDVFFVTLYFIISTVPEIKSTFFLTETMFIIDGIFKKGDVVYVLPDTYTSNYISAGTGWWHKA